MTDFAKMLTVDVRKFVTTKQNQKYMSWVHAWQEFKRIYPDANYKVIYSEFGIPYTVTPLGIMVRTEVTANGETLPMHLPVMNNAMKSMKEVSYTYQTKNGEKQVEPATMMDVNKAIMRCLTKNIAMFGLGLFIYSGEDAPEQETVDSSQLQAIVDKSKEKNLVISDICAAWQVEKLANIYASNFENIINWMDKTKREETKQ